MLWKSQNVFSGIASDQNYGAGLVSGSMHFLISDGGTANDINFDFRGKTPGDWHLVTCVWSGNTGSNGMRIFVDGVLEAQGTASISAIAANAQPLRVAGKAGGVQTYEHYDGYINQAVVYPNAQTLPKHIARYNRGILGR
jgi:hypothetical protein